MIAEKILFCVWLIPAQPHYLPLQTTINELAEQYDAPSFQPHSTLFCGKTTQIQTVKTTLSELLNDQKTITTDVVGLDTSADYYKTLYLQLQNKKSLIKLNQQFKKQLDPQSTYTFNPHLSLLYKDFPLEQKKTIAATLREKNYDTILFDKVLLMSDTNEESAAAVNSWKILQTYNLKTK